jgi:hypothetical protein
MGNDAESKTTPTATGSRPTREGAYALERGPRHADPAPRATGVTPTAAARAYAPVPNRVAPTYLKLAGMFNVAGHIHL